MWVLVLILYASNAVPLEPAGTLSVLEQILKFGQTSVVAERIGSYEKEETCRTMALDLKTRLVAKMPPAVFHMAACIFVDKP